MLLRTLLVLALLATAPPVGQGHTPGAFNMSRSEVHISGAHNMALDQQSGSSETAQLQSNNQNKDPNREPSTDFAHAASTDPVLPKAWPPGLKSNQSNQNGSNKSLTLPVPSSNFSSGNTVQSSFSNSSERVNDSLSSSSPKVNTKDNDEAKQKRKERRLAKERQRNAYRHENFVMKDRNLENNIEGDASLARRNNGSNPSGNDPSSLSDRSSSEGRYKTSGNLSQSQGGLVQNDGRNPYRHMGEDDEVTDKMRPAFWSGDIQVGCRELRARRYITDGFCTSEKPIKEVVCAGHCLPIMEMPWYAEFIKTLARTKLREYQCVEDLVRKKRVRLLCQNGELRFYRIKVVKSCKCKRIVRKHNRTADIRRKGKKRRKSRRRKNRKNKKGRVS